MCNVLVTIDHDVGVGVAPNQGAELDPGNEELQLIDFVLEVLAIYNTGKVKHFGSFVNLGPESVLH